jgi:1,4-alpha-glucan branching enzyme
MPGDDWQKFANLRLLYGYQWTQPGKKLLFMGGEVAQRREWAHEMSIDWDLLHHEKHRGVMRWVADLNAVYRAEPALYELDTEPAGFKWVEIADAEHGTLSYLRLASSGECILVAMNLTPIPRHDHPVGVPTGGHWRELLNSDAELYGGSGQGNLGGMTAIAEPWGEFTHRLELTFPPLGLVVLKAGD